LLTVVDSSGWIEAFVGGPNAHIFRPRLLSGDGLIVPTIVIFEVTKYVRRDVSNQAADRIQAWMEQCEVAELDTALASYAARVALTERLAMADSIIWATSLRLNAELWTQDAHFSQLAGVRYIPKPVH
jgi:predicted nucleic acid-binding protein